MHHAYLSFGSLSLLPALVENARATFGFEGEHNPDLHTLKYEKFGIEEARELSAMGALKSSSGRALYIMGVSQITSEAQQALLKLFEEPQAGTTYILLAPHGSILPTLKSRFLDYPQLQNTPLPTGAKKVLGSPVSRKAALGPDYFSASAAASFLKASGKARSAEITKLLKDDDGMRERVRSFLDTLETILYAALQKAAGPRPSPAYSREKKELREGLEDIAQVRSYANDRSPSLKMLLEHLALSLPSIK